MSISLVHGDMLKSVSKNFYRNIYSHFTLTKKAKILCNGDLKPSNNYIRLFSGLNNYIWFFRDDKINQVTYYFGQTEKDNTNNDLSNIEPLKPVFSVTFNLKKSNLSNGRFFTDEKGNIIGNILVNRLNDKQYDLLKKLGLKINTLKNKKNNENKHLISFYNTKNPEKSLKILEKLLNNIVFQNDENNNIFIIKIHEKRTNKDLQDNMQNKTEIKQSLKKFDKPIRERLEYSKTSNLPYSRLNISETGNLTDNSKQLDFTILDAKNIHEAYNEGQEIEEIASKYNLLIPEIERIILRYDSGDFKILLTKILIDNPSNSETKIEIKNNSPYYNLKINNKNDVLSSNKKNTNTYPLRLNLNDIKLIFKEYENNRSIESLGNYFNKPSSSIERIINRIIAGDFNEILPNIYKISKDTPKNIITHENEEKQEDPAIEVKEKNLNSKETIYLKTIIKNLKNENKNLKESNEEKNEKINKLFEDYKNSSREYNNKIKELSSESKKLENKINNLEKGNKHHKQDSIDIKDLQNKNKKLERYNENYKKNSINITDLKNKNNNLEKKLEEYRQLNKLSDIKEEYISLKIEKIDLERELKKKSDEIEKLTYKNRKLESKIKTDN